VLHRTARFWNWAFASLMRDMLLFSRSARYGFILGVASFISQCSLGLVGGLLRVLRLPL